METLSMHRKYLMFVCVCISGVEIKVGAKKSNKNSLHICTLPHRPQIRMHTGQLEANDESELLTAILIKEPR